ncbi:MAG TPA: peptidase M23, partial [Synechococcales bacterium UBA12195]|nr:peptidase M23 [Synechococcales bacterium UBA12195]
MLVLLPLLAQLPTPSLQQLEQQQVITPAERRRLERGSLRAAPTPA